MHSSSRSLRRSATLIASCFALAFGSGAAGCSEDEPAHASLAQGCVLNSDCSDGLVCTLGRCHVVCRISKDCDAGARCVSANGKNVCILDAESTCAKKEPCTEPLICASDLKCRSGCTSADDCPAEQVCARGGVCADNGEVDSVGNLLGAPPPDAGGSGGSGTGGVPATGGGIGTGGTSTGGAPEAGPDTGVPEASTPADASMDSSSGCQSDSQCPLATPTCVAGTCLADTVLLVAAPTTTTSQSIGASFDGNAWTATDIGNDIFGSGGGGVAVMPDGRGMAVLRGNQSPRFRSASYNGAAWSQLADADGQVEYGVGVPIANPTGFLEPHLGNGRELQLATYSVPSGWSPLREIGSASSTFPNSRPVVVETAAGDPFLLFDNGTNYEFTVRSAGNWSSPGVIPGATLPSDPAGRSIAGVRQGSDIVAMFLTGAAPFLNVKYSVWSSGAWSPLAPAATGASTWQIAATALRDGRVALAYVDAGNSLQIGFFDGAAWSAFKSVPGAVVASYNRPVGIARGAHRTAALEVAFIDSASVIRHTRLTDEANWTWTPAVGISTSRTYGLVSIATGP